MRSPWHSPVHVVLKITDIKVEFKGQMRMPRAVNILFPLPYEDSDDLPQRAKIVRYAVCDGALVVLLSVDCRNRPCLRLC